MADRDLLLSLPEAAHAIGVTRVSVWHWVHDGRLPARRLGAFWYVRLKDLVAFERPRIGRPPKSASAAAERARAARRAVQARAAAGGGER